jgi:hypothetical protein
MFTHVERGQFLAVVAPWPNAQELPAQFPPEKKEKKSKSRFKWRPQTETGGFHEKPSWAGEVKPCVLKSAVTLHVQMSRHVSYIS